MSDARDVLAFAEKAAQHINLHLAGVDPDKWADECVEAIEGAWRAEREMERDERHARRS
jgi:hypothetical protein